jgi:hypothetical protein
MFSIAHLAGNPCSGRETIETYFISPLDFSLKHEITCTTSQSKYLRELNIHEHINRNTQRINTNHEFESEFFY